MFEMIRKIWRTGIVTCKLPLTEAPYRYRGKLAIQSDQCNHCGNCIAICPAEAIRVCPGNEGYEVVVAYGKCILCGLCAEVCANQTLRITNNYHMATKNKEDLRQEVRIPR